ncbi:MAG: MBG domain-containing protein, partial [Isosphaerales bacterium]
MEQRTVLSAVSWTGGGGNFDWDIPQNWSSDALPGPGDDVTIDLGANDFTVTHSANVMDAVNSLTSQAAIAITGGTLSLGATSTIAAVRVDSGTLDTNGDLTINGPDIFVGPVGGSYAFYLYNGTLGGTGTLYLNTNSVLRGNASVVNLPVVNRGTAAIVDNITLGAGLDNQAGATLSVAAGGSLAGSGTVVNEAGATIDANNAIWSQWTPAFTFGMPLVNAGTVEIEHGDLYTSNGATITNTATGVFDEQTDGIIGGDDPECPTFDNQGLFIKSGGTGVTDLEMELDNSGTVRVIQGDLTLDCGYVLPTGSSGSISGSYTGTITNSGSISVITSQDPPPVLTGFSQTISGKLIEQIGGLAPGTQYGQIVVNGDVNLNGTLGVDLINGFAPHLGDQFTVIANQGTNPIQGAFTGLAEGSTVWAGAYGFTVSYVGGTSQRDLVLTASVVQALPTVTVSAPNTTYNAQPYSAATATVTGVGNAVITTPAATFTYYAAADTALSSPLASAPSDAGSYQVVASFAGNTDYLPAVSQPVLFSMAHALPALTLSAPNITYNAQPYSAATATVTGVGNAVITTPAATFTYYAAADTALSSPLASAPSDAGSYQVVASFPGNANYLPVSATGTLTITPAGLTITANNVSKVYGNPNPGFTVSYAGFVNGETASLLGGTLNFTTPATISSPVGTYTVTPRGLTSTDYTITYVAGNLTVTTSAGSVYVLDKALNGAVTISGNATIKLPGDLVVDSSSTSAIVASGNASVTALSVQVGGGVSKIGNASVTKTGTPGATGDPLSGLAAPTVPGYGIPISESLAGNSNATISQGAYSQIVVSGNAKLTLNPGVYVVGTGGVAVSGNGSLICSGVIFIIQGGGFTVSGNASITGRNVLIYNAASGSSMGGVTLSGNGTFKLNAATTGPDANILIDQPASNTRALNISGNAMLGITGTIHAPSALLTMSGNGSLQNPLIIDSLNLSGNVALTQMAAGSDGAGDAVGIANTLPAGNLNVYISDPAGFFTSDMLARIQDTINAWDALLVPYNVTISEVSDPTLANLVIDDGTTSASGDMSNDVLGCYNPTVSPTEITLIQGWNWYAGADATQIGSDQYDFQTTVSHELGHALGLGGSDSLTSPMNETLPTGTARRVMTIADLNIPYPPDGADPLTAAGFRFVTAPGALAQNGFAAALSSGTNLSSVGLLPLPSAGVTAAPAGQAGALVNAPLFAQASTNQSSGQLSVVIGQWSVASGQVNAQAGSGEWGASEGRRTEDGGWRKDRSPIPSALSPPSSALPKWEVLDSVLDELDS